MSGQQTTVKCRVGVLPGAEDVVARLAAEGTQDVEWVHLPDARALVDCLARGGEQVDAIVASGGDLGALRSAWSGEPSAKILEVLEQGAAILEADGRVSWSNQRLAGMPAEAVRRAVEGCRGMTTPPPGSDRPVMRRRRFTVSTEDDRHFEVVATPLIEDSDRPPRVAVVISDVTVSRRLQRTIDAIDAAGAELVRLDAERVAALDAHERLKLLEQKIIRYTRDLLHFDNFAIRLLDRETNRLELVLHSGLTPEAQNVELYAEPEGNGICGYVAATGRSYICPRVEEDPRYVIGIERAASSLTVPIRLQDQVIGVFNVESDRPAAFTEDDRQLAEIFARYVGMALYILDLLIVERSATTGRLADDVAAEIAGPLNDIMTDATTLIEDYIGHDDLRKRLQSIVESVGRIRQAIKQVARPTTGLLGRTPEAPGRDPLLAGRRVLVADDEESIRETIAGVLTRLGCEVDTARDGDAAVAMIESYDYDLVLSDIRMPGKNGYQIFAAARDRNANTRVILMTGFGYDPNHSIIAARREGLSAVLFKPFKCDQLLDEIRAALGAAAR